MLKDETMAKKVIREAIDVVNAYNITDINIVDIQFDNGDYPFISVEVAGFGASCNLIIPDFLSDHNMFFIMVKTVFLAFVKGFKNGYNKGAIYEVFNV